jgi:hypothetical protein
LSIFCFPKKHNFKKRQGRAAGGRCGRCSQAHAGSLGLEDGRHYARLRRLNEEFVGRTLRELLAEDDLTREVEKD